jgi:GNAT superfamily N-acetyltransferase
MPSDADVLTALRRSDRALAEQLSQWESLDFGVAYYSPAFASLAEANQLRDVWLADVDAASAYARAEAYYAERGVKCFSWTPASAQPVEPVEKLLLAKGWRRVERLAMGLVNWDALNAAPRPSIRTLPARAMPRAYRATFADDVSAAAARERLNDSNLDAFVALVGGQPAGRISYLSVGDAARLADLHVDSLFHEHGVGAALIDRFLVLARRLMPKTVVASVAADDLATQDFIKSCGFAKTGVMTYYTRVPPNSC